MRRCAKFISVLRDMLWNYFQFYLYFQLISTTFLWQKISQTTSLQKRPAAYLAQVSCTYVTFNFIHYLLAAGFNFWWVFFVLDDLNQKCKSIQCSFFLRSFYLIFLDQKMKNCKTTTTKRGSRSDSTIPGVLRKISFFETYLFDLG